MKEAPVTADHPAVAGAFDRPAMPVPRRLDLRRALAATAVLGVIVAWVLHPIWPYATERLIGDPDTDVVRGMWGFDHVRRSLVPPDFLLWSDEVNFPSGVLAVVLPLVTAVLTAPVGLLAGPVAGFNLAVAAALLAAGAATAWLVRVNEGRWSAGTAAGAALLSQPMLLHAVADGTAEHFAVWSIPVFLATSVVALRRPSPRWGLYAGAAATVVALDSPYNAVFAGVAAAVVLPASLPWRRASPHRTDLAWTLATLAASALAGALLVAAIYRNFALGEKDATESLPLGWRNATDLGVWWQFDWAVRVARDPSLAPTLIPAPVLFCGLALCLAGVPRSLPWLAAALVMIMLSFGVNSRLGAELAYWVGGAGNAAGDAVIRLNAGLYELPGLSSIRFPARWLVPAAMALLTGAGIGLSRLFALAGEGRAGRVARPLVAGALAVGAAISGVRTARFDLQFPAMELPGVAFADWLDGEPGHGAVLLLPQVRPAPSTGRRGDLPVFANISAGLSSADLQYLQVRMGRPVVSYPSLKTLTPFPIDAATYVQYRHWDDLTLPKLTGNAIPRAAVDEHNRPARVAIVEMLVEAGLGYVALDLGCFDDEGVAALRRDFEGHLRSERRFDDGDGVLVFELR